METAIARAAGTWTGAGSRTSSRPRDPAHIHPAFQPMRTVPDPPKSDAPRDHRDGAAAARARRPAHAGVGRWPKVANSRCAETTSQRGAHWKYLAEQV